MKVKPGMRPVVSTPAEAIAALEADLPLVLRGRTLEEVGWKRPDPLTLLVPLSASRGDQADEYLLKLGFGYYRAWPPSAQFVNPATLTFVKGKDNCWLPRISDPKSEIATHAEHQGVQLICCSVTLEFYLVGHGFKPEHGWDPSVQNFAATLNAIERGLKAPLYGGPMAARS